jgi:hypothetical protein
VLDNLSKKATVHQDYFEIYQGRVYDGGTGVNLRFVEIK